MQRIASAEKDVAARALETRTGFAADQLCANLGLISAQPSEPVPGLIYQCYADARFAIRRAALERSASCSPCNSCIEDPAADATRATLLLSWTLQSRPLLLR